MATTQTVDTMLGLMNNCQQTNTLIENQRAIAEGIRGADERNTIALSSLIDRDSDRSINMQDRNHGFTNQNINAIGSSLRDIIQSGFSQDQAAIERTAAMNLGTTERVGNSIGLAVERNGGLNHSTTERVGGTLGMAIEKNNKEIMSGFKDSDLATERNFGETRLYNSTLSHGLQQKIGDYYLNTEKNFGKVELDLSKVENSIGRQIDHTYHNTVVELLKLKNDLQKDIASSEKVITKQADEHFNYSQIEAVKNKYEIQKNIVDGNNELKYFNYKDGNDTRDLFKDYKKEDLRTDLQYEKLIHALHHHYPHGHHHAHHGHHGHHGPHWDNFYGHRPRTEIVNNFYDNDRRCRSPSRDRGGGNGNGR